MLATLDETINKIELDLQAIIYNMISSTTPVEFQQKLRIIDEQLNQQVSLLDATTDIEKTDRKYRIMKIQNIQSNIDKAINIINSQKRRGRPPKKQVAQVEIKKETLQFDVDYMNNVILEQANKIDIMEETNKELMTKIVDLMKENAELLHKINKMTEGR